MCGMNCDSGHAALAAELVLLGTGSCVVATVTVTVTVSHGREGPTTADSNAPLGESQRQWCQAHTVLVVARSTITPAGERDGPSQSPRRPPSRRCHSRLVDGG